MKNILKRFSVFLKVNWLRLLIGAALLGAVAFNVVQYQTSSILAATVGKLSVSNATMVQEASAQNVKIAQLEQDKSDLEDRLAQAAAMLQQSVPLPQVIWCTDMAPDVIPQNYTGVVQLVIQGVAMYNTEVEPNRMCIDFLSIYTSPLTGELSVYASREFPGGAVDRFVVYIEPVPGQDGYIWITGIYNVVTHEGVQIDHESQTEEPPSGNP